MIPDRNPPDTWVSVRDHRNLVSPGQKRPPRGTLATPVPQRRQPGGKATGYSAAGLWGWMAQRLYSQLAGEDGLGQERGDEHVGRVDHLADLEVDRDAADRVSLLPRPPPLGEVVDHVEQRVAGREGDVLGVVDAVPGDRDPRGGVEPARRGVLRRQVVLVPGEPEVADVLLRRLALADGEAHAQGRAHLDRGAADLPVALGEMGVARREEPARGVHRDEQARALAELLDVDVAGLLAGRDRAQPLRGQPRVARDGGPGRRRRHEAAAV